MKPTPGLREKKNRGQELEKNINTLYNLSKTQRTWCYARIWKN